VGLYRKFVLPHLIDLSMKEPALTQCRSEIIPRATGRVLEVGIGSGLNFPFYGAGVSYVWGLDPSAELLAMARSKAAALPYRVELLCGSAEDLPLDSASADTVVLTWTLCSIPNPSRALHELRRVLKPGGSVIFAEHGLAPDPTTRTWQGRLNPLWKRIAGGCNMNRKIDELIVSAGFSLKELRTSYFPGPRILTYTYQGIAVQQHAGA
jgi:ubiquinone/menaquinone biosynthesis C-methylase UbiE